MSQIAIVAGAAAHGQAQALPVHAVVARAYRAAWREAGTLVRIAWFWCLVLLGVNFASNAILPTWMTNPQEIMALDGPVLLLVSLIGCLNALLILPVFASIAVNWHRVLLLGETPKRFAFARLDSIVWAYVWLGSALVLARFVGSVPHLLMAIKDIGSGPAGTAARVGAGVLMLVAFMVLPRLSLALPGCAIGDGRATFKAVFVASRGNTVRLCWGALLCFLPALLVGFLTFAVWPGYLVMTSGSSLAHAVQTAESLLWPLLGIVFVSFMSYSYEHICADGVKAARQANQAAYALD